MDALLSRESLEIPFTTVELQGVKTHCNLTRGAHLLRFVSGPWRTALLFELVDRAFARRVVQLAGLVLPEGGDVVTGLVEQLRGPVARGGPQQAPDVARAIIAIQVDALPFGQAAAIHIAAGDRAASLGVAVC